MLGDMLLRPLITSAQDSAVKASYWELAHAVPAIINCKPKEAIGRTVN